MAQKHNKINPSYFYNEALREICQLSIYQKVSFLELINNPYLRPLPEDTFDYNYTKPLLKKSIFGPSAYRASLLLRGIYESDLFFLPENSEIEMALYESFYNSKHKILGEIIRPVLEAHVYTTLENSIQYNKFSTSSELLEYLAKEKEFFDSIKNSSVDAILSSSNSVRAARNFLIRIAPDSMAEGSALLRRLLGSFGIIQSELFKILIDEYGSGLPEKKHNNLFLNMIQSCGLHTELHRYWHYYTPSSLVTHNYFHYLSKNTNLFFRYLGKLFFAEMSFANPSRQYAFMLKKIFGNGIDVRYFEEHGSVDICHGNLVLEQILHEIISKFGSLAIKEIIVGYETIKELMKLNNQAFIRQINWMDECDKFSTKSDEKEFHCSSDTILMRDVHEHPIKLIVEKGNVLLKAGYDCNILLSKGESFIIPEFCYYILMLDQATFKSEVQHLD